MLNLFGLHMTLECRNTKLWPIYVCVHHNVSPLKAGANKTLATRAAGPASPWSDHGVNVECESSVSRAMHG
jgi:hypothetical protein